MRAYWPATTRATRKRAATSIAITPINPKDCSRSATGTACNAASSSATRGGLATRVCRISRTTLGRFAMNTASADTSTIVSTGVIEPNRSLSAFASVENGSNT